MSYRIQVAYILDSNMPPSCYYDYLIFNDLFCGPGTTSFLSPNLLRTPEIIAGQWEVGLEAEIQTILHARPEAYPHTLQLNRHGTRM